MRLRSFFATLATGTAATLTANLAHADLILNFQGTVSGAKYGTISVFNNGSYKNSGVSAGMLTFQQKAPGDTSYASDLLGSFCIEPKTTLLSGDTLFNSGSLASRFDQPRQNLIARLYDLHYETVTTLTDAASAFQLALWEIVTDGANLSLSSGNFLTTSAFGTATALAVSWLDDLTAWNNQLGSQTYSPTLYDFVALSAGNSQDQLTVTRRAQSVPEPGVLALLGIGVIAGFAGRRRKRN